jgi:hypothetical protein
LLTIWALVLTPLTRGVAVISSRNLQVGEGSDGWR